MAFIALQRYQSTLIARFNEELGRTNEFLSGLAKKIAKYLPPQLYRGIFAGEKDVEVATERKKLTVFFSDVVNFASTAERMQPEELTALLNEYLTEMSTIAAAHGGTINKLIGDAILVFFGDPEVARGGRRRKSVPGHGFGHAAPPGWAQRAVAKPRHQGAVPSPHGYQYGLL